MQARLPRKVFIWLGTAGIVSLAFSMWLEFFRLEVLQAHPISVNLLSGIVGFCGAAIVIGVGFNWLTDREHQKSALEAQQIALDNISAIARNTVNSIVIIASPDSEEQFQTATRLLAQNLDSLLRHHLPAVTNAIEGWRIRLIEDAAVTALDDVSWFHGSYPFTPQIEVHEERMRSLMHALGRIETHSATMEPTPRWFDRASKPVLARHARD